MRYFIFLPLAILGLLWSAQSTQALSITPTKQAITVEPGAQQDVRVTIINEGPTATVLKTLVDPFSSDTATGLPVFGESDEAAAWVDILPRKLTLRPGEQTDVTYTIRVPKNAEPGAHYLGLFAQTQSEEVGIAAGTRIGSLLFLYVAGDVQESLLRRNFSATKSFFISSDPTISLQMVNEGTIHVVPTGEIVIQDMWDRRIEVRPINPENRKVLPRAVFDRSFVFSDLPIAVIGPVTAYASVNYGLTNQTMTASTTFWVLPVPILIATLIICACILFLLFYRRHSAV